MDLLKELLAGALSGDQQSDLSQHLDECESCQRALDDLAFGDGPRPQADGMGAGPTAEESVMLRAMQGLKADAHSTDPAGELTDEEACLRFLGPTDQPGGLGCLGSYEVTEILGRGGFGLVLKALDPSLNRYVAIKVLLPQLATSAGARKRFAREARAAAAVSHEHVVAIHNVDEVDGLPYLVMEYVPGQSLQQRLDRTGPLELAEILRIGMQTASGLAAAHAQGVIHRDIKPANILLENGVERVKITDFGLARTVDDASLTQSGVLAGTPQYMAPEQARGEAQDHRVDLFSLGSVLYALCTGHPPFRANTTMAVLRRVSDETPHCLRDINPAIPEWLEEIIARLHAKDPAERFPSAADVAELLSQHLAHLQQPFVVPMPGAEKRLVQPATTRRRRSRRWALAAAVLVLALGGLGVSEVTGGTELTNFIATVLRIRTPTGTLVVEVDDPQVDVNVDEDGKEITISGAGVHEVKLRAGQHRLKATKEGVSLQDEIVSISRGGKQIVKVSMEGDKATAAKKASAQDELLRERDAHQRAEVELQALRERYNRLLYASNVGLAQQQWTWGHPLQGGHPATPGEGGHASGDSSLGLVFVVDHPAPVLSVAFSPDGKSLATGDKNQTVRVWDISQASNRFVAVVKQGLEDERLSQAKKELLQLESDLRRQRVENLIVEAKAKKNPKPTIPDALVESEIALDPEVQKLRPKILELETKLNSGIFNPESAIWRRYQQDLESSRKELAEVSKSRRSGIVRQLTAKAQAETKTRLEAAQERIEVMQQMEKLLNSEIERLARELAATNHDSLKALRGQVALEEAAALQREYAVLQGQSRKLRMELARQVGGARNGHLTLSESVLKRELERDKLLANYRTKLQEAEKKLEQAAAVYKLGKDEPRLKKYREDIDTLKKAIADEYEKLLRERLELLQQQEQAVLEELKKFGAVLEGQLHDGGLSIQLHRQFDGPEGGTALAFSPDGQLLATSGNGNLIHLWDASTGQKRRILVDQANVSNIAFSPDGKLMAAGDSKGSVLTWQVDSGAVRHVLKGHAALVQSVTFSPDGQTVTSGSTDRTVRIWDAATGEPVHVLSGHRAPVVSVAVSPDGKLLASTGEDDTLRLWEVATGKELRITGGQVWSVAFSPDGKWLAAATSNGAIRLRDVATGHEVRVLQGHRAAVTSLAFSPDGHMLASGSLDGTVRLWDLAAPTEHTGHTKKSGPVQIEVRQAGDRVEIRVDGEAVAFDKLPATLKEAVQAGRTELVLTVAQDVTWRHVVNLQDIAKTAGIQRIDVKAHAEKKTPARR
jgi:WD40 repeat protein